MYDDFKFPLIPRAIQFLRKKLNIYKIVPVAPTKPPKECLKYELREVVKHLLISIESLYYCWLILKDVLCNLSIFRRFYDHILLAFQKLRGLNGT